MQAIAKTSAAILSALLLFGFAPRAEAQTVGIHYAKQTKHGSFGLSYSSGRGVSIRLGYDKGKHGYGYGYGYAKPAYAPVYCPPPPPAKVWVPGSWQIVDEKVWVPGKQEKVWVDSVYATHYDACGNPYQVLVQPGHWKVVSHPGCWQVQQKKVWQPGHWKTVY